MILYASYSMQSKLIILLYYNTIETIDIYIYIYIQVEYCPIIYIYIYIYLYMYIFVVLYYSLRECCH